MRSLENCTALVTGASAGIGREIARQLAPHAEAIVLVARRIGRLEELKRELQQANPGLTVHHYAVDLTNAGQLEGFIKWLFDNGFRIDLLVNNAGLGDAGPFLGSDWTRTEAMIEVNVRALTRLTRALVPGMVAARDGAILNVSSVAGLIPVPDMAVYAATKAYVTSFSEALRMELRGTGVNVTTLCPGPVDTEFQEVARRDVDYQKHTPDFFKVPVRQVAAGALRAVVYERPRVIPGLVVCAAMTAAALLPMFVLRAILSRRARNMQTS